MNQGSTASPSPAVSFAPRSPFRLVLLLSLLSMAILIVAWPVENASSLGGSVISHWQNALFDLRELRYRPAQGVVRSMRGEAYLLKDDGHWVRLKVDERVKAGMSIRTRANAQVHLFLDQNGPVVRLGEDSLLEVATLKYRFRRNHEMVTRTELVLRRGQAIGVVRKPSVDSLYTVSTPKGAVKVEKSFNLSVGRPAVSMLTEEDAEPPLDQSL